MKLKSSGLRNVKKSMNGFPNLSIVDHWPLYDLLQSSTDSTKNTNRSLSQFRKLHTQSSYRDQLTVVCNILLPQQDASNKDYAKMLMKYEAGMFPSLILMSNDFFNKCF